MRITISGNRIAIRSWGREKFAADASELSGVRVTTGGGYTPVRLASALVDRGAKLKEIALHAGANGVALGPRAAGFADLVPWLKQQGWAMDAAITEAIRTPLVSVAVSKT